MPKLYPVATVPVASIQFAPDRDGVYLELEPGKGGKTTHAFLEWSTGVLLVRLIQGPAITVRVESGLGCDYTVETDKDGAS